MSLIRRKSRVVVLAAVSVGATLGIVGIVWMLRPPEPGAPTRRARNIVAELRAMPSSPLQLPAPIPALPAETHAPRELTVVAQHHPVRVTLPGHSTEPLRLEESTAGMAIELAARGPRCRGRIGGRLLCLPERPRVRRDAASPRRGGWRRGLRQLRDPPAGARGRLRLEARQGGGGSSLGRGNAGAAGRKRQRPDCGPPRPSSPAPTACTQTRRWLSRDAPSIPTLPARGVGR